MKRQLPPWMTPVPPGMTDTVWCMMWAVAYLLASVIVLAAVAFAIRVIFFL